MKGKNLNPIKDELIDLKLINVKKIINISKKTRDKSINVLQEKESKIIFLEKYITHNKYYSNIKYAKGKLKTLKKNIVVTELDDDSRRKHKFNKLFKQKEVLDFGCGWGGFLNKLTNAKSVNGIELRNECINYIKNKRKKIVIKKNLESYNKKFDIITMFHVLEHLPKQVETLKSLKRKLKKKGKIIIEVPHAEDFLLEFDELKEFKKFTFWSEHLILHTYKSLKTVLHKAGFKKIKIEYFQRYGLDNHLGWFIKKKPGGHNFFKKYSSKKINLIYKDNLVKLKKTDTLIAIANNK